MSETKHTPRPWKLQGGYTGPSGYQSPCLEIGGDANKVSSTIVCRMPYEIREGEAAYIRLRANARLIAAAPRLLEAAKAALAFMDERWPAMNFGIPADLRAAIAEAEGSAEGGSK